MIPIEKLRHLAGELLRKTQANEANWNYVGGADFYGAPQDYILKLPKSVVGLKSRFSRTTPDVIRMSLYSAAGEEVGNWAVEEGENDWDLLKGLYDEVDRTVRGWGEVLADIEQAVQSKKPIGAR
jgi:hypothetical protein